MTKAKAERLRARFRAFALAHFGCGALNPHNTQQRCEHDYGHATPHSWYVVPPERRVFSDDDEPGAEAAPVRRRRESCTWTKVDGRWCIRVKRDHQVGDVVCVLTKRGVATDVYLGEQIASKIFMWDGNVAEDDEETSTPF